MHLLDDFDQVYDDIRPFWGLSPQAIRSRIKIASALADDDQFGLAVLRVRNGQVPDHTDSNWRLRDFAKLTSRYASFLPNMDILINTHDQPRVVVPHAQMSAHLADEARSRQMPKQPSAQWSSVSDLSSVTTDGSDEDEAALEGDIIFEKTRGLRDYVIKSCASSSPAGMNLTDAKTERTWKEPLGRFVRNFTASTDLCQIGPGLWDKHGMLFDPLTLRTTQTLLPIFSECKTSVHSDILFPGLVFWNPPDNFKYDSEYDVPWNEKSNQAFWRGTNSGGHYSNSAYKKMHRSRLVLAANNDPALHNEQNITIARPIPHSLDQYPNQKSMMVTSFAKNHTDIAFNSFWDCGMNCYEGEQLMPIRPNLDFKQTFRYKYMIDVDGHSFSGRWRAFLLSRCLGIKSTIHKDWHGSRLFAWKHFVPLDNNYGELWNILMYYIGWTDSETGVRVQGHDAEAERIATEGRNWAEKVLRPEDMEVSLRCEITLTSLTIGQIYTFRLMLEYARVVDDNRDTLGYSGDGSEFDDMDLNDPMS